MNETLTDQTEPEGQSVAAPEVESTTDLREGVVEALKTVYDPEIPVNIYELGLVYKIDITEEDQVLVEMTLTSPACPVAGTLPGEVESKVLSVSGVQEATVELVWDPPWDTAKMSEAARLQLGIDY